MFDKTKFTYVSPKTNDELTESLCIKLPIDLESINSVEELFPLLLDQDYRTDFIAISIEMFYDRKDRLDIFDIIHTLATLIKSTVYRDENKNYIKRDVKILVLVDETTHPTLIKQVMNFPDIASVALTLTREDQFNDALAYVNRLITKDYSHDPQVLRLLKTKKKSTKPEEITLTHRQQQILSLLQNKGCSNKIIAKILNLSESTVKLHIGAILKKYNLKNRTQLALFTQPKSKQKLEV